MMQCPVCHGRNTGKVGTNQYYCWQCLLEFSFSPQHVPQVFYIEEDGSLVPLAGPDDRPGLEDEPPALLQT